MFFDLHCEVLISSATNRVKEKQTAPKIYTTLNLYAHGSVLENCKRAPKCSCGFSSVDTTQQREMLKKTC